MSWHLVTWEYHIFNGSNEAAAKNQKENTVDITITRHPVNGAWLVSAIVCDNEGEFLMTRTYYGYTKVEAVRMFKHEVRGL